MIIVMQKLYNLFFLWANKNAKNENMSLCDFNCDSIEDINACKCWHTPALASPTSKFTEGNIATKFLRTN